MTPSIHAGPAAHSTYLDPCRGITRRNRDLAAVARRHGVRYDGVDVAQGP